MAIGQYSDDEVRNWMAGKSDSEVAAQAASMGLNAGQVQSAYGLVGKKHSKADITGYASANGYSFDGANGGAQVQQSASPNQGRDAQYAKNAAAAGWNVGGTQHDIIKDTDLIYGGGLRRVVSNADLKNWFSTNKDPAQWAAMAAQLGMNTEDVAQAITKGTGAAYDPRQVYSWINGTPGYAMQQGTMRVVAGNGPTHVDSQGMKIAGFNGASPQTIGEVFGQGAGGAGGGAGGAGGGAGGGGNPQQANPQGPLTGVMQPGQTAGQGSVAGSQPPINWGAPAAAPSFNTPTLDALYNAQQQRMTTPAPNFNFQGGAPTGAPGALTQVVQGS